MNQQHSQEEQVLHTLNTNYDSTKATHVELSSAV